MFYPIYVNLQDRKCLVVGGGTVAERKVVAMLISGGDVTVISPDATELLTFLANIGTIRWHKRQVEAGDTHGYFLVCAATDFTDINTAVFREAHEKNKIRLVNVVDVIPQCTFAAASVITDGELMVSISTSGKSPATSRRIREYLERLLNADSLYTLGYEDGAPVPIENQELPYPVYLLLENRKCVVLCEQETAEIERRVSLLRQCGASVMCMTPDEVKPHHFEDAFLVIAEETSTVDLKNKQTFHPNPVGAVSNRTGAECPINTKVYHTVDLSCESGDRFIREYLDEPDAGTHSTPQLIVDDNLIISVAARSGTGTEKAENLLTKLANPFENNGYGTFIEFLGTRRSEILKTFPTPKKRAAFFDTLIDTVEMKNAQPQACCLGLTNPKCSAECLFNWVRSGDLERANAFVAECLSVDIY